MARRRTETHRRPEDILVDHDPRVRQLAERLRRIIRDTVPEATEVAYPGWHAIGYRHPRSGYFCGIFPQDQSVTLAFEWGVLLTDPEGLLRPGTSGSKQVRYLEVRSPKNIPVAAVRSLLLEAVAIRAR